MSGGRAAGGGSGTGVARTAKTTPSAAVPDDGSSAHAPGTTSRTAADVAPRTRGIAIGPVSRPDDDSMANNRPHAARTSSRIAAGATASGRTSNPTPSDNTPTRGSATFASFAITAA